MASGGISLSPRPPAYRFSLDLSPQAQGLAVGGATFASLVFGVQTQYWFIGGLDKLDYWFWTACTTLLAIWVLLVVSAGPMKELLESTVMRVDDAADDEIAPRAWKFIWYFLLYALAFGSVYVLGWFTVPTGGTTATPYAFALIAVFAGSIFVARRWWVPILVFAWTVTVAIIFTDWSDSPSEIAVPKWLIIVTVSVNALITLAVWLFRVWYHHRIERRLAAISAVAPSENSSLPQGN